MPVKTRQLTLTVVVTTEDLDAGNDQCSSCPIALAATRALGEAGYPLDGLGETWHVEYEPYRLFDTPEGLTVWRHGNSGDEMVARVPAAKVSYEAYEFASMFDDWFRSLTGDGDALDQDGLPYECPGPFSFKVKLRLPRVA